MMKNYFYLLATGFFLLHLTAQAQQKDANKGQRTGDVGRLGNIGHWTL